MNASETYVPDIIELGGSIADEEARQAVVARAHHDFPFGTVHDIMGVRSTGASGLFATFALSQLTKLSQGDVQIVSRTLNIHGVARSDRDDGQEFASEIKKTLPPGLNLGVVNVSLPDVPQPSQSLSRGVVIVPEAQKDNRSVDILFATDRGRQDGDLRVEFTSDRANALTFGMARVHVPDSHRAGNLELPGYAHRFFGITIGRDTPDPNRHFILTGIETMDLAKWKQQLASDEAVIFVHGYNTSFQAGIFRLAQIVWDLQYRGPAILFSWPSRGGILQYEWDRNSALVARQHFIRLVKLLRENTGIKKVHVLAHSMGNFVVLDALATYAQVADPLHIEQLIMAAPDIDSDQYRQDIEQLSSSVSGMTLYASANDRAMLSSRIFAQGNRAGDIVDGEPILVSGVDAIDVSAIGEEMLGLNHDTFASKRVLINDIRLVLAGVRPPNKRLAQMREAPDGRKPPLFWRYMP